MRAIFGLPAARIVHQHDIVKCFTRISRFYKLAIVPLYPDSHGCFWGEYTAEHATREISCCTCVAVTINGTPSTAKYLGQCATNFYIVIHVLLTHNYTLGFIPDVNGHQHPPSQGGKGKKRNDAPVDPATMYESLKNRIAALEEEEVLEEEEERRFGTFTLWGHKPSRLT